MRRLLLVVVLLGAAAFLVGGGVSCDTVEFQPDCYVALKPGPTENATGLVEISGTPSYASSGELRLTTIAVEEDLGLTGWLRAAVSGSQRTVPRTSIFPSDADREEVTRQNAALMSDSQLTATTVALRHAGFEVDEVPAGARVTELLTDAAERDLRVGDVISAVDGQPTLDSAEVAEAIGSTSPGEPVTLEVVRDGQPLMLEVLVGHDPRDPDRPLLGVLLTSQHALPVDVDIDAGVIGGPSAGLVFALSIIDLLDPGDLTGGAVVAGTGTLTSDGRVGPVGGVRQKILGAAEASDGDARPATVFLVPEGNLDEARGVPVDRDLLVVPVASLDEALDAVAEVRAGRRPAGALALSASR